MERLAWYWEESSKVLGRPPPSYIEEIPEEEDLSRQERRQRQREHRQLRRQQQRIPIPRMNTNMNFDDVQFFVFIKCY